MIAALGMYDFGPAMAANDQLWALIRDHLRAAGHEAPDDLTRGETAYWQAWEAPDLLLSQTCGYPFRARLHGNVTYVGTPDYDIDGCPPGHYNSVFVTRKDDPRQTLADYAHAAFAYNEALSQSGWAAPQTHARALGLHLPPALATGGHLASARAVADGHADIAALDGVTWALMQDSDPVGAMLKPICRTAPTPGLPIITAKGTDPAPLFDAFAAAIAALPPADRATLHIKGITRIPLAAYLSVPNPPSPDQIAQAHSRAGR